MSNVQASDERTIRLHISPLNPLLLDAIILLSSAHIPKDVSYHSIPSWPENDYGYFEMPATEAAKLRKKLNGSILKGKKLKLEEARPKKRLHEDTEDVAAGIDEREDERKLAKRARRHENVVPGHGLSPPRQVKRGWTTTVGRKAEKRSTKSAEIQTSKYTNNPECLFQTNVPLNRPTTPSGSGSTKRKDKKGDKHVTVHEFQASVKQPSFLREAERISASASTQQYVDGKGWVDQAGNIKEGARADIPIRKAAAKEEVNGSNHDEATSSSGRSSEDDGSVVESHSGDESESIDATSVEGTEDSETAQSEADKVNRRLPTSNTEDTSSSGSSTESSEVEERDSSTLEPEVHPLEALFKRPKARSGDDPTKPSLEVSTTFSFFEPDTEAAVPQTPFSRQELASRNIRSAAPPPDSASADRTFSWDSDSPSRHIPPRDELYRDEEVKSTNRDENHTNPGDGIEESEFATWFWENRGDNNRAWKRRRREAAKEKRQRENRKQGRSGA